jgi:uncharacterized protein YcbK (DUF882 family)
MHITGLTRARLATLTPHACAHALQLLHEVDAPMAVSSVWRTPARNRAVGGSPNSYHLRRRAVDFTADGNTLIKAAAIAWRLRVGPGCTGPEEVLLEYLGGPRQHLHVAW